MLLAALLLAQAAPACTATDAGLPPALAGWTAPVEAFGAGRAVVLDAKGGAVEIGFRIETPGRYGVALDQGGWIDVTASGADAPLKSVAHGHGPECSSIRKIVRFDLAPGAYRLSIGKLTLPQAKVMLVAPE